MLEEGIATPYHREMGSGPGVVCLHPNASHSGQRLPLMEQLSPNFRMLAPDTLGAGNGPPWPEGDDVTLLNEATRLEPLFTIEGNPFSLVGHSYGGAVALIAALANPGRVKSMVLYGPTCFRYWRKMLRVEHHLTRSCVLRAIWTHVLRRVTAMRQLNDLSTIGWVLVHGRRLPGHYEHRSQNRLSM